jgi:hypothetical protein
MLVLLLGKLIKYAVKTVSVTIDICHAAMELEFDCQQE